MQITVVDEQTGNPFIYSKRGLVDWKEKLFPRHYETMPSVRRIWRRLLKDMGLGVDISALEVGAGANPQPSQALSNLGREVCTLDADWTELHTDISHEELGEMKRRLGKDLLVPRLGGRTGDVESYLGDIGRVHYSGSKLRGMRFDLVYFWGSLIWAGNCSSVQGGRQARARGTSIPLSTRMNSTARSLTKNGTVLAISPLLNGYMSAYPENINVSNGCLADHALYWALGTRRRATSITFWGQSNASTAERIGKHWTQAALEEYVLSDPLEQLMLWEGAGCFGKENDYAKLRAAHAQLKPDDREKVANLGIIDAIAVSYAKPDS